MKKKRSVFHERVYLPNPVVNKAALADAMRKHGVIADFDPDLLSNKARKAADPSITLSVLPIDAILNAYSLTVQLILAIREDMTPEQRKAGWLWLEKIQKLIDAALQPK
jgi:hypothetical protein